MDFNVPPKDLNFNSDQECTSERDGSYKTNVKDGGHPIWSSEGLIYSINYCRKWGNSKEQELNGEIPNNVFESLAKSELQTKFPADLTAFMMDWENDITSGGGDAQSTAMKGIAYVNQLRSIFGRDPMHGEILCAHAFNSASIVKQIYDLAEKQPEEEAKELGGGKKQNIIYKKLRNDKEVKRNNREVYDFFWRRMVNGKMSMKMNLGNNKFIGEALQGNNNSNMSGLSNLFLGV